MPPLRPPPGVSSGSRLPCLANHAESGEASGAYVPITRISYAFCGPDRPAGMGRKIWLPFPVLLLAALRPALLPAVAGFTHSLDSDFTFTLPAGRRECFYQPMPLKASLEIEYQVSAEGEPASVLQPGRSASPSLAGSGTSRGRGLAGAAASRHLRAGALGRRSAAWEPRS